MKVINKISDDLIEIREYAKPNACFQTNEYPDNYDFVVLREIFNPFDLFNDNKIKDMEIERLNNIINGMEKFFKYAYDNEVKPLNDTKISVWTICLDKLKELKGDSSNDK